MVFARAFLILERMANNRPKRHVPGHIVSLTIKQNLTRMEERGSRRAEEEGKIALRAKRPINTKRDGQWNTLLSEFGSRPSQCTAAKPGHFLRGPSRPFVFLRVKNTPRSGTNRATCAPMTPLYTELQVTTNYSFLRGASHIEELVARAAVLRMHALGVTDRNSLAGIVRAHQRREGGRASA